MKCEPSHSSSPGDSSPEEIIKGEIPNVNDSDFHARGLPILARPTEGLNVNQLFTLITPSIKICAGCRNGYARASDGKSCLPPPLDLCLVQKEQHLYYNVIYEKQQLSMFTIMLMHHVLEFALPTSTLTVFKCLKMLGQNLSQNIGSFYSSVLQLLDIICIQP